MKSFVELIQRSESNCSRTPEVRVKGKNINISAGKIMHVNCKSNVGLVKKERAMIFQSKCIELPEVIQFADCHYVKARHQYYFKVPLINDGNHITIMKNTVIGNLQQVTFIVPLEVRANTSDPTKIVNAVINKAEVVASNEPMADPKQDNPSGKDEYYQKVLEKIDFSGLTHGQREQVRKMLKEESSVFTVASDHIGNDKMAINLRDNTPVQQSCNAIPRALYGEVKS